MKTIRLAILVVAGLVLFFVAGCSTVRYCMTDRKEPQPGSPVVPDETTAVRISEAVLIASYGEGKIKSERPFRAVLSNGVWYVRGSLPRLFRTLGGKGGVASAEINMEDGRVLRIHHGK